MSPAPNRKRRRSEYYVVNMPPPWARSLTESGMKRKPTRLDHFVVAGFLVLMCAFVAGLAYAIITAS